MSEFPGHRVGRGGMAYRPDDRDGHYGNNYGNNDSNGAPPGFGQQRSDAWGTSAPSGNSHGYGSGGGLGGQDRYDGGPWGGSRAESVNGAYGTGFNGGGYDGFRDTPPRQDRGFDNSYGDGFREPPRHDSGFVVGGYGPPRTDGGFGGDRGFVDHNLRRDDGFGRDLLPRQDGGALGGFGSASDTGSRGYETRRDDSGFGSNAYGGGSSGWSSTTGFDDRIDAGRGFGDGLPSSDIYAPPRPPTGVPYTPSDQFSRAAPEPIGTRPRPKTPDQPPSVWNHSVLKEMKEIVRDDPTVYDPFTLERADGRQSAAPGWGITRPDERPPIRGRDGDSLYGLEPRRDDRREYTEPLHLRDFDDNPYRGHGRDRDDRQRTDNEPFEYSKPRNDSYEPNNVQQRNQHHYDDRNRGYDDRRMRQNEDYRGFTPERNHGRQHPIDWQQPPEYRRPYEYERAPSPPPAYEKQRGMDCGRNDNPYPPHSGVDRHGYRRDDMTENYAHGRQRFEYPEDNERRAPMAPFPEYERTGTFNPPRCDSNAHRGGRGGGYYRGGPVQTFRGGRGGSAFRPVVPTHYRYRQPAAHDPENPDENWGRSNFYQRELQRSGITQADLDRAAFQRATVRKDYDWSGERGSAQPVIEPRVFPIAVPAPPPAPVPVKPPQNTAAPPPQNDSESSGDDDDGPVFKESSRRGPDGRKRNRRKRKGPTATVAAMPSLREDPLEGQCPPYGQANSTVGGYGVPPANGAAGYVAPPPFYPQGVANAKLAVAMNGMSISGLSGLKAQVVQQLQQLPAAQPVSVAAPLGSGPRPPPQPVAEKADYNVAARPAPATRAGKKVIDLLTNAYELDFDPCSIVYRYDVNVELEAVDVGVDGTARTRMISLNRGARDDASQYERHELILVAVRTGLEIYRVLDEARAFGGGASHVAHDGASILYANGSLEGGLKRHGGTITITVNDLPVTARAYIRNLNVNKIAITITACNQPGFGDSFKLGDLKGQLTTDRSAINNTLKQFYEIITSAQAIDNGEFALHASGLLYKMDPKSEGKNLPSRYAKDIGNGMERIPGVTKGYSLVDGGKGRGGEKGEGMSRAVAALIVDNTMGTFWKAGLLVHTVCEMAKVRNPRDVQWTPEFVRMVDELLKDLRVVYLSLSKGTRFCFSIGGLTADVIPGAEPSDDQVKIRNILTLKERGPDGAEVDTLSKFGTRNINLANWPCIIVKNTMRGIVDGKEDAHQYFPIELLEVLPNQRVPIAKQLAEVERADNPAVRFKKNAAMLDSLNLMAKPNKPNNPFMEAFGVRLSEKPMKAEAIVREMPSLTFLGRKAEISDKGTWKTGHLKFEVGATIELLVVSYIQIAPVVRQRLFRRTEEAWAKTIMDGFREHAKRKGLRIKAIEMHELDIKLLMKKMKDIVEKRARAQQNPRKVIYMLIEPSDSKHHKELKLLERKFNLPTIHLTTEIAARMNEMAVSENLLAKLNIKAGGANYRVIPENFASKLWVGSNGDKSMIFGYDVWHPTAQPRRDTIRGVKPDPSCVGFSFNGGVLSESFVGDYHFQESLKEQVARDVLNMRMKWMLGIIEKKRGCLPEVIIITRDGVSDGQFTHAMDELMAFREAAREYAASTDRQTKTGKDRINNYEPKFLFIVATKRHHRRFGQETVFRGQNTITNAPAMSVVDNTVTAPTLHEFFLQAHTSTQGTAKITRYVILKDDIGVSSDAAQALMAALCFGHQVSPNSISIPEPIFQADRWAQRGAMNYRSFADMFNANVETPESITRKLAYMGTPLEALQTNA